MKAHVASIYYKCFRCFRGMLQVFHMDVAIIDRDVAHVSMVVHVCCKRLFQMFHLLFQTYVKCAYLDVAYVSHICCKSMFRLFPGYVASVSYECCKNRS